MVKNSLTAIGVACLFFVSAVSWKSMKTVEKISEGIIVTDTVRVIEAKKPTCVPVYSKACDLTLTFYQHDGEGATAFAQRIKRELEQFEKGWGE